MARKTDWDVVFKKNVVRLLNEKPLRNLMSSKKKKNKFKKKKVKEIDMSSLGSWESNQNLRSPSNEATWELQIQLCYLE